MFFRKSIICYKYSSLVCWIVKGGRIFPPVLKRNSLKLNLLSSVKWINFIFSCPAHLGSSCSERISPGPAATSRSRRCGAAPGTTRPPPRSVRGGQRGRGHRPRQCQPEPLPVPSELPAPGLVNYQQPAARRPAGRGSFAADAGAGARPPGAHPPPAGRQHGARPTPEAALCAPPGPPAAENKPSSWSLLPRSGCCGELLGNRVSGLG